jgi:hypothetical protein
VLFLLLTGINCLLFKFDNPWIDGISRSMVLAVAGAALLYGLKVSEEVNHTAGILFKKVKGMFGK